MATPPAVTVLMAVYNGERFLEEAVRSVLAQSFHSFEFLIVDDGSKDGTASILDAIADTRVRVLRNATNLQVAIDADRTGDVALRDTAFRVALRWRPSSIATFSALRYARARLGLGRK